MSDMRIWTLVCAKGVDAFYHHRGGVYPCDSRWITRDDAADMLGIDRNEMRLRIVKDEVPVNFDNKVSLEWVEKLLELRKARMGTQPDAC